MHNVFLDTIILAFFLFTYIFFSKNAENFYFYCMFRKMFVCVRKSICGWKKNKKKFGSNFQNYLKNFLCRHQKNASHTISIYGNCMISIFFKNKNLSFLSSDCFIRIKQPQKWVYTSFQPFLEIVWKLYDKHFPTNLMYGIVW